MNCNISLLCTIILFFTNCFLIEGATFRLNSGVTLTAENWTDANTWLNESNQNVDDYPGKDNDEDEKDIIQFGSGSDANIITIDFDFEKNDISTSLYFQPLGYLSVLNFNNGAIVEINNILDNEIRFTLKIEENASLTVKEELTIKWAFVTFDIYGSFTVLNNVNFTKEQYLNIYSDAVVKFEGDFNTTGVMLVVEEDAILEIEGQYIMGYESQHTEWDINGFLIVHRGIKVDCYLHLDVGEGEEDEIYINTTTGGVYVDLDVELKCDPNNDQLPQSCNSELFCEAIIGNSENPEDLPVNLISFILTEEKEGVKLEWVTASEQNSERFDIQVSSNKKDWTVIGSVLAQGNSNSTVEYEFDDTNKPSAYYRLAQYDFDGKVEYFGVLTFNQKTDFKSNVYPTFVGRGEYLYINFEGIEFGTSSSYSIVNLKGEIVEENQFLDLSLGNSLQSYHIKNDLNTGLYFITIRYGKEAKTMRFVIK
ncbi:hypothetical protein EI427_08150 [Flammeovirga pectinis]|uniref:T9SS type A sorting domain-containing protein n=1 Tax=Flammeovirga pectinis TaxID=2494373 RepID=A0A3Q9FPB3_9BACT|nr:hypothetical protein [Flammeovirga pectinis]AZQ62208.1 hypothetical protein EI427_08150 [Flammeovirga pectinis]